MFVVKGSSDLAANRAPAEQVPSELSMDGAELRAQASMHQAEGCAGAGPVLWLLLRFPPPDQLELPLLWLTL